MPRAAKLAGKRRMIARWLVVRSGHSAFASSRTARHRSPKHVRCFAIRWTGLLEGGVDFFMLETFSDLDEIHQALLACARAVHVAGNRADDDAGRRHNAVRHIAGKLATQLDEWDADVVGLNCSVGPAGMLTAIERFAPPHDQEAVGTAQRRTAARNPRSHHVHGVARIHGEVLTTTDSRWCKVRRWLLRHHARAYPQNRGRSACAGTVAHHRAGRGDRNRNAQRGDNAARGALELGAQNCGWRTGHNGRNSATTGH